MKPKINFNTLVTLFFIIFCASCSPKPASISTGFIEPDPETYVSILPVINEYFYHRKQAVITGNPEDLFTKYPELISDTNISKGINAEEFHITNYRNLHPIDGNIFPEYYEKIKIKIDNDKAEVLLHGMEIYLWSDENGEFKETGGEFKMIIAIHLVNGQWVIDKTDEVTQSEWSKFSP